MISFRNSSYVGSFFEKETASGKRLLISLGKRAFLNNVIVPLGPETVGNAE